MDILVRIILFLLDLLGLKTISKYLFKSSSSLEFHKVHGSNVTILKSKSKSTIAMRDPTKFDSGVVFSHRAIKLDEIISIRILHRTSRWKGTLFFGVTNRDPARFDPTELKSALGLKQPLLDGYSLIGPLSLYAKSYSKVAFCLNTRGECMYQINNNNPEFFQADFVDLSRDVWAVFDLFGSVTSIQLIENKVKTIRQLNSQNSLVSQRKDASSTNCGLCPYHVLSPLKSLIGSDVYGGRKRRTSQDFEILENHRVPVCVICLSSDRHYAFVDCGHLALCTVCAQEYLKRSQGNDFCPVCRQRCTTIIRIY